MNKKDKNVEFKKNRKSTIKGKSKIRKKKKEKSKDKKKKNKVRIHSPIIERIYNNFNNSKIFFYLNSKKKKSYF